MDGKINFSFGPCDSSDRPKDTAPCREVSAAGEPINQPSPELTPKTAYHQPHLPTSPRTIKLVVELPKTDIDKDSEKLDKDIKIKKSKQITKPNGASYSYKHGLFRLNKQSSAGEENSEFPTAPYYSPQLPTRKGFSYKPMRQNNEIIFPPSQEPTPIDPHYQPHLPKSPKTIKLEVQLPKTDTCISPTKKLKVTGVAKDSSEKNKPKSMSAKQGSPTARYKGDVMLGRGKRTSSLDRDNDLMQDFVKTFKMTKHRGVSFSNNQGSLRQKNEKSATGGLIIPPSQEPTPKTPYYYAHLPQTAKTVKLFVELPKTGTDMPSEKKATDEKTNAIAKSSSPVNLKPKGPSPVNNKPKVMKSSSPVNLKYKVSKPSSEKSNQKKASTEQKSPSLISKSATRIKKIICAISSMQSDPISIPIRPRSKTSPAANKSPITKRVSSPKSSSNFKSPTLAKKNSTSSWTPTHLTSPSRAKSPSSSSRPQAKSSSSPYSRTPTHSSPSRESNSTSPSEQKTSPSVQKTSPSVQKTSPYSRPPTHLQDSPSATLPPLEDEDKKESNPTSPPLQNQSASPWKPTHLQYPSRFVKLESDSTIYSSKRKQSKQKESKQNQSKAKKYKTKYGSSKSQDRSSSRHRTSSRHSSSSRSRSNSRSKSLSQQRSSQRYSTLRSNRSAPRETTSTNELTSMPLSGPGSSFDRDDFETSPKGETDRNYLKTSPKRNNDRDDFVISRQTLKTEVVIRKLATKPKDSKTHTSKNPPLILNFHAQQPINSGPSILRKTHVNNSSPSPSFPNTEEEIGKNSILNRRLLNVNQERGQGSLLESQGDKYKLQAVSCEIDKSQKNAVSPLTMTHSSDQSQSSGEDTSTSSYLSCENTSETTISEAVSVKISKNTETANSAVGRASSEDLVSSSCSVDVTHVTGKDVDWASSDWDCSSAWGSSEWSESIASETPIKPYIKKNHS